MKLGDYWPKCPRCGELVNAWASEKDPVTGEVTHFVKCCPEEVE